MVVVKLNQEGDNQFFVVTVSLQHPALRPVQSILSSILHLDVTLLGEGK